MLARGTTHYGVIYTYDGMLPRNTTAIPLWVAKLAELLAFYPAEDALLDRTHVLL